jgi:hypothetical protein
MAISKSSQLAIRTSPSLPFVPGAADTFTARPEKGKGGDALLEPLEALHERVDPDRVAVASEDPGDLGPMTSHCPVETTGAAPTRESWRLRPDSNRGIRVLQTRHPPALSVKYDVLGLFLTLLFPRVPLPVGMRWEW